MFNWNHIEKLVNEKNQDSGYMKHILSSIQIKNFEIREVDAFLSISVPNIIIKEICERDVIKEIENYVSHEHNKKLTVHFLIENGQQSFPIEEINHSNENDPSAESKIQNFEFFQKYALNRKFTFETYINTLENGFTQKALHYFTKDQSSDFNCACLIGPSGTGKTHLLHAAGWGFLDSRPGLKVKVVSSDDFINDFQTAIYTKSMTEFRNKYRLKTDVLLIDDIQSMEKAKGTQGELFNLMNDYALSGKKIIITSDKNISEMAGLEDRLKSRFMGGLVLNTERPSLESKSIYLQAKLGSIMYQLDKETLQAVINQLGDCYRSIEGAIGRLQMLYKLNGSIEKQAVLKMFPVMTQQEQFKLTVEKVLQDTAIKYKTTVKDLTGPSRKKLFVEARKEAIKMIRNNFDLSLKDIGRLFGRDHSSIMHALK